MNRRYGDSWKPPVSIARWPWLRFRCRPRDVQSVHTGGSGKFLLVYLPCATFMRHGIKYRNWRYVHAGKIGPQHLTARSGGRGVVSHEPNIFVQTPIVVS